MLEFESLSLKNCVYFSNSKLMLNTGKILVVNGKNLKSREKNQSNGAGKSLFFSYIPNILFSNHPLAIKANSKKELYLNSSEDSSSTIAIKVNDTAYKIRQCGGSSIKYKISKNGKQEQVRTTLLSEKYITNILPISESEFYTLVYLNSQRDFIFQRGKFESRLKFFTDFFRLDYFDQMKLIFQEDLKKVKRVEIEVSTIENQRLKLVTELKELDDVQVENIDEVIYRKEKLQLRKKNLKDKISILSTQKGLLDLKEMLDVSIGGAKEPSAERIKELKNSISILEERISIGQNMERLKCQISEARKSIQETKNYANEISQKLYNKDYEKAECPDPDIADKFNEYHKVKVKYESRRDSLKSTKDMLESVQDYENDEDPEILHERLAECAQQITTFKKLNKHISNDLCPICGSTVDLKILKEKSVLAESSISSLKRMINYHTCKNDYLFYVENVVEFDKVKYKDLHQQHNLYKKNYINYINFVDMESTIRSSTQILELNISSYRNYKEKLSALPETSSEISDLRDELSNNSQLIKLFKQLKAVVAKADAISISLDEVSENVVALLDSSTELNHRLEVKIEELLGIINTNNVHVAKTKLLRSKLSDVSSQIEKLNIILADKEILETLVKVYSSKGIKIQKINSICRLIEKNLNHFKSLIFGENFKFQIEITEKSFDVIVDRGDGVISDVRQLSGSEGRRFNLLLLISLLPLTPKSRRTNLVVLDEMESCLDTVSLDMFCNRFIPELHKYIPNVVVVSPLALSIPKSQVVLVVKDESGASLEFLTDTKD